MDRGRGRGLPWLLVTVLAAASFVAAGVVAVVDGSPPGARPDSAAPAFRPVLGPPAASSTTEKSALPRPKRVPARRAQPGAGVPERVVIDALDIDARVVAVASEGQTLDPPADPQLLGWWSSGARTGAATGTALVTGHTVHSGGGALDDLERVAPGTRIRVRTSRGWVAYVAASTVVLGKEALARRAPRLFSQTVRGRLVLVTCEGWDGNGYRSNVVTTATAVPSG